MSTIYNWMKIPFHPYSIVSRGMNIFSNILEWKTPDEDLVSVSCKLHGECRLSNRVTSLLCNHGVSLILFFIQYTWNERGDRQCFICAVKKIYQWLQSVKVDLNDESIRLDVKACNATKSEKIRLALLQIAEALNDDVFYAQLAHYFGPEIRILRECKGDLNYKNGKGHTLLHVFLEECKKNVDSFSKDQIIRTQQLLQTLIEKGSSLYVVDNEGKMPFNTAIQCKNIEIMNIVVSAVDVHATDGDGNTILHLILKNCVDEELQHRDEFMVFVRMLVSKGADVNLKNIKGESAVNLAAEKFNVEALELLADNGADFEQPTEDQETPLHSACKSTLILKCSSKMIDTINLLVSKGCKIEMVDKQGYMPLHYAAEFGSVQIVERLIELGASVCCQTQPLLLTPLHLAAKADRIDNIKILIRLGADVNSEAIDVTTPIFMTVMWGSLESMEYLMEKKANVHLREKYRGFTLLHLAAHEICDDKVTLAENDQTGKSKRKFEVLIEKGFNVDDPGYCGVTPLHLALTSRNIEFVKILIERGANPNFQSDIVQWTAMHIATIKKDLRTIEYLVEKGLDINCRGGINQETPLHLALMSNIKWGLGRDHNYKIDREFSVMVKFWVNRSHSKASQYRAVAMFLIEKGADLNAKNSSGRTALHLATLQPNTDLIKNLLKSGARVNVPDVNMQLPIHNVLESGNATAFKLLLENGGDINEEDISQLIINSNDQLKKLAIEQAIKLTCIGLPIANVYKPMIKDPTFANYLNQCSNEAKTLSICRDADFSLYEFLHMDWKNQCNSIKKIYNSYGHLEERYPIYFPVIQSACKEAINRKVVFYEAKIAWKQIPTISLPDKCIDYIFSYLNNRNLEALTASTNMEEKSTFIKEFERAYESECRIKFTIKFCRNGKKQ